MTACKDVQDVNLGKKAVSAALAGTLAVGMVPGVALAATADDATADDGIESLALNGAQDFSGGAVTGLTVNGAAVSVNKGVAKVIAAANGGDNLVAVNQVTTMSGTVVNGSNQFTVTTSPVADGTTEPAVDAVWTPLGADLDAGNYWVKVTPKTGTATADNYSTGQIIFQLQLTNAQLSGVFAYEVNDDNPTSVKDKTFVYNGNTIQVGFAKADGTQLVISGADPTASVDWYKGTGVSAVKCTAADVKDAGTYTARISNVAGTTGYQDVVFTVAKLDLSKATIVMPDVYGAISASNTFNVATINNVAPVAGVVSLDCTGYPEDTLNYNDLGEYTFSITPGKDADGTVNKNVIGSATVKAAHVQNGVKWTYNGTEVTPAANNVATGTAIDCNLQDNEPTFDATKLVAGTKLTAGAIAAEDQLAYTIQVTDEEGNVVANNSVNKPGKWTVTAKVDAAAAGNDYAYGGTYTVDVEVVAGEIADTDVVVKVNGVVKDDPNITYTGKNVLDTVNVAVNFNKKPLVAGTDYTIEYTDATGNVVTEIVNKGTYTGTITAPGYEFAAGADSYTITVDAIAPEALKITNMTKDPVSGSEFFPYTGKEITPVVEYTLDDSASEPEYVVLPAEAYTLTYTMVKDANGTAIAESDQTPVTVLKDAGEYKVAIASSQNKMAENYTLTGQLLNNVVVGTGKSQFMDVPSTAWYYDVVNEAAAPKGTSSGGYSDNPYMNGYAGTKLFGPNDRITRGQVACVLFNMAGGNAGGVTDDKFNEETGYVTGFSDVDGHAYYAQAIAWAKTTGVVNGYAGTDKFGPNDFVTREQFAAMLANYAKASGKDIAVEDAAAILAAMPDGAKVSDWAKDSVAWAVSNKYMGNGGTIAPQSSITRAEVAAMAINYQPRTKIA